MYEIPSQNLKSWKETLSAVPTLPITHLSLYNLTFEPNTLFFKKRKKLAPLVAPEEERVEMLTAACEAFKEVGLNRYEISAFAKGDKISIHNTGYWVGREFLGFGPSAFSYLSGKRFCNVADLKGYAKALEEGKSPVDFEEKLDRDAHLQELLAIGLRMIKGVDLNEFERVFSPLTPQSHHLLDDLEKEGFLQRDVSRIALSEKGLLFYDLVAEKIIL